MSKRVFARAAALLGAAVLSAGVLVVASSPAQAASLGPIEISQTSGSVTDTPMFASATSSAPCPTGYGENANLRVGRPGGPYSNLFLVLGGGGYDEAPITINPNRSFETALGAPPGEGVWWIVMECYSLTEGRHPDEFRTIIQVCAGGTWTTAEDCPSAAPTTTALAVEPSTSIEVGTTVTLTAQVTPSAAGTVRFRRTTGSANPVDLGDPVDLVDGVASLDVPNLPGPLGAPSIVHVITASFVPADANAFLPSTSPAVEITVRQVGAAVPTTLTLAVSPTGNQPVGTVLTLTATVAPGEAAGAVSFGYAATTAGAAEVALGEVDVAAGIATFQTTPTGATAIPQGTWHLRARFTPDDTSYANSTAPPVTVQIGQGGGSGTPTTTTLAVSPEGPQPAGTSITLTATVAPGNAAGSVTFRDGANPIGSAVPVTNGTATMTTTALAVGTHSLTARFVPATGSAFEESTSSARSYVVTDAEGEPTDDLTVTDADGAELPANPVLKRGQSVNITARGFTGSETVTLTLDGAGDMTATASNGIVEFTMTVPDDAAEGAHQAVISGANHTVTFDFTVAVDDRDGDGDGDLATTGAPIVAMGVLGLVLVGVGAGTMLVTRRRTEPEAVDWPEAP
jgi:hypothetical protein